MMFRICRRGSLTVEAALTLPLFMTGLLTLVSSLYMCLLSQKIQASLLLAGEQLAVSAANTGEADLSEVRGLIVKNLTDADLKFIENGSEGLDLSDSVIDDGEYISLDLSCRFVPFSDALGIIRIPYSRHCLSHAWNGYGRGFFDDDGYVYVTQDSEVYHCNRDCTHLRLTVNETTPDKVGELRNTGGAKYRPCGHCHASLSDAKLYVTPDGDRYHNTVTCSGLKRTVNRIRKSDTHGRRPCSRCGR